MPATLHGNMSLVFGCDDTVADGLLQTSNARRMGKYSEAVNFEDDVVGIAVHHTNVGEIDGTYLFAGSDIVTDIGDALGSDLGLGFGEVIVYEFGRKRTKDGYEEGDFRAVGVDF